MRKTPPSDPDRDDRPAPDEPGRTPSDAAASAADSTASESAGDDPPSDENTAPSLVWPPVEDELNEWEVLHLQPSGHTILEPLKRTPPAQALADPPSAERRSLPLPPTSPPYVPPTPIDDPAGETSLLSTSSDYDLPETELIEPLSQSMSEQAPALPTIPAFAGLRAIAPAPPSPDDRTVVIQRPAAFLPKSEPPMAVPSPDATNAGAGTRILVAPAFAASVGHAPTVPVSALHRAERPPRSEPAFGPRLSMEDTLPAGVTREVLARGGAADRSADRSDDTVVRAAQADTHPVPAAVARHAQPGPTGPPSPFSRVPSRGPQPVVTDGLPSSPAPMHPAPPPLAFGPRVPSGPPAAAVAALPPLVPVAPAHELPGRDAEIPRRPEPTSTRTKLLSMALAVAAVLLVALGVYQIVSMRSTSAAALAPAALTVESSPAGAAVAIDGKPRGKTPLRLELTEGRHAMEVSLNGATRHIPLVLAAGTATVHSLEFAAPVAAVADSAIEIRSDPPGGRVLIDGQPSGSTPIVVRGLTAGRHEVQVSGPFRTVTRTVTLAPRQQALLVVTPARTATTDPAAPRAAHERPARADAGTGFITIQSPIVLRVVRNGDFVGTSEDSRLSLPVGNQVIGLENESVGFRDVRTVEVIGGKVTPVEVTLPKGELSINARPWAEVFVDGNRVGETPVSQLSLPVGVHEILFRHPEHGERTVSVVVKIGATGRAFTDFTK